MDVTLAALSVGTFVPSIPVTRVSASTAAAATVTAVPTTVTFTSSPSPPPSPSSPRLVFPPPLLTSLWARCFSHSRRSYKRNPTFSSTLSYVNICISLEVDEYSSRKESKIILQDISSTSLQKAY